jgi:hypothetical protein
MCFDVLYESKYTYWPWKSEESLVSMHSFHKAACKKLNNVVSQKE